MYCTHCGAALSENSRFCSGCGVQTTSVPDSHPYAGGGRIGFSSKIYDPSFAKYIKDTSRWSVIFSYVVAVAAVVIAFIYGEVGSEVENPEALLIGLGLGGMFLIIGLFTRMASRRSKTWDGVVVNKTSQVKEKYRSGGVQQEGVNYTEYVVHIQDGQGKIHRCAIADDAALYNYFQVGDHVRHHAGLDGFEKYDKSRDSIIFCTVCNKANDINTDNCYWCKLPLLN